MHVRKYLDFAQVQFCKSKTLHKPADLGWNLHQVWWGFFSLLEVNNDKSFLSFVPHTEKLKLLAVTSAVVFNTASP